MSKYPSQGSRVARTAALLALGGLAVHQLRYLVAFGSASGEALHREGHDYLSQAAPILLALAAAAMVARLLVGAVAARRMSAAPRPHLIRGLSYAIALGCLFSVQELAEGALAAGHPAGLAGLLGGGGWIALPLALAFGLGAGLVEHLLERAEGAIAVALAAARRPDPAPEPRPPSVDPRCTPLAAMALAFGFARRPPPAIPIT